MDFRVRTIPAEDSGSNKPSNDYYEGILFSDGLPKPVPEFPPPPDPNDLPVFDEEYEDVEVNEFFDSINEAQTEAAKPFPDYENLPHIQAKKLAQHQHHQQQQQQQQLQQQQQQQQQNHEDIEAMLFSVGLRFPSIRVKREDKKKSKIEKNKSLQRTLKSGKKVEPLYSFPDKGKKRDVVDSNVVRNEDLGSCPKPAVAVYDGLKDCSTKSASTLKAFSPSSQSKNNFKFSSITGNHLLNFQFCIHFYLLFLLLVCTKKITKRGQI